MTPLPVLISIPHGGRDCPPELSDRVAASPAVVFEDIDPFTREIYRLGERALHTVDTAIARTFVDLNRAEDDLPPANPDGVVKSLTCFGKTIYRPGAEPDAVLRESLLARWHRPYHQKLATLSQDPDVALGLDCHSMAAVAPEIAPDPGRPRPSFCLSDAHGATCPPDWTARIAACFAEAFELAPDEVAVNRPFSGGYITRRYGLKPRPWLQIEMSRALYLAPPWFDPETLTVDPARLAELNRRFHAALAAFFQNS